MTSPFTTPNFWRMTFATGARQLVVQEALEMMWWRAGSYFSSLTPMQTVISSPVAGAEMITFFAPPSMCARALSAAVKKPVDSITMSTPRSPQGRAPGSRSARTLTSRPPTRIAPGSAAISSGKRPRTES